MYLPDLIWTILLFAGLVQGLFVAGVLISNRGADKRASALLAVLSLVLALMLAEELVDTANLYTALPHAALSVFSLPLAIGPLLYMSARQLGQPSRRMRTKELLHFLPLVAVVMYLSPFYILDGPSKLIALDGVLSERIGPLVFFKGIHVLGYQAAAIVLCGRILGTAESGIHARVLWFRRVLLVAFVPVFFVHVLYFFPQLGPVESDRAGSLVIAVLLYSFAYAAMKWPFFRSPSDIMRVSGSLGIRSVKYRTSSLDQKRKNTLRDDLLLHMKTKEPFRNPDSSPGEIADALDISVHDLSQILNDVLHMNFHNFLNSYRIELVKEMMADPSHDHRTLLQLAFEAGFNSKTSFNRVFKEDAKMTPSNYRRQCRGHP
jgi:AraC-like DNA-binding protein